MKKRWERDSRTLSNGDAQYWVAYRRGNWYASIDVLQDDEGYHASLYWGTALIGTASWGFYDTDRRFVDFTTIPRCFAWLVNEMKESFFIDIPMEEV